MAIAKLDPAVRRHPKVTLRALSVSKPKPLTLVKHQPSPNARLTKGDVRHLVKRFRQNQEEATIVFSEIVLKRLWEVFDLSFAAFCKAEMPDFTYGYLNRLRNAIELHAELEPEVDFGAVPEYLYRDLLKVLPEDRKQVWQEAKRQAGRVEALSKELIREAIEQTKARPLKAPPQEPTPVLSRKAYKDLTQKLTNQAIRAMAGQPVSKAALKRLTQDLYRRLCQEVERGSA